MTQYLIWTQGDRPEDGDTISASDAKAAACQWAKASDADGNLDIAHEGLSSTVTVRDVTTGVEYTVRVKGTMVPTYSAKVVR